MSILNKTDTHLAAVLRQCVIEDRSVTALARADGISRQAVHDLLAGTRLPGRHVARALAAYLSARPRDDDGVRADAVRDWAEQAEELSEVGQSDLHGTHPVLHE